VDRLALPRAFGRDVAQEISQPQGRFQNENLGQGPPGQRLFAEAIKLPGGVVRRYDPALLIDKEGCVPRVVEWEEVLESIGHECLSVVWLARIRA
jgi:hypothetical protein